MKTLISQLEPIANLKIDTKHLYRYAIPSVRMEISPLEYSRLVSACAVFLTDLLVCDGKYFMVGSPTVLNPSYSITEVHEAALYASSVEKLCNDLFLPSNQRKAFCYYDESIKEKEIHDKIFNVRNGRNEWKVVGVVKRYNNEGQAYFLFKFI